MLQQIAKASRKYGLRIVCVAHAGDGNVHPFILFDERDKAQVERVWTALVKSSPSASRSAAA